MNTPAENIIEEPEENITEANVTDTNNSDATDDQEPSKASSEFALKLVNAVKSLNNDEFTSKVENDEFLEHAIVHKWNYGTLKSSVKDALESGVDIIMDIDVQGAQQVRECQDSVISNALVDIFITTKDVSELESRLRGRGSEDDETFQLRMVTAKSELEEWNHYTYYIISGTPEDDFSVLSSIINSERIKVSRISS